ncbi:MAG: DUF705 domain-containing protein [Myxococcales bacterium]|nr:DUF705 domain-containing protein [Myxococcales bacterium]
MREPSELPLVVFVDVDDTLIRSFGSKRIAMSHAVERVRQLHADGVQLYCWSSGGGDYARESAREVGLEGCFLGFLPKPHVLIDDVLVERWPLVELHPNEAASVATDDLRARAGR